MLKIDKIFMDFSKAFDKVSHSKLLFKLHCLEIAAWLFRFQRTWIIAIGLLHSKAINLTTCPSAIGCNARVSPNATPFSYINKWYSKRHVCKIKLYTDDCVLYTEVSDPLDQALLNNDIQRVASWCKQYQMCMNFNETVFM